ncbi:MAG TPA: multicopper oxidase domain-containing protein [Acetobacteraceae bacterium]|nr:multicopper oxidase domain-containing protein [Acetobacteraceae bacterium]
MPDWKEKLALTAQRNRQEIVRAKLDRREMMRLGLLTAGGALVAKAGLSSRAGFAASGPGGGGNTTSTNSLTSSDGTLSNVPPSPPINNPWSTPMPRLTIKAPIDASQMTATVLDPTQPTGYRAIVKPPDGFTPIDGATKSIQHQYCGAYDPKTNQCGPGTAGNMPPQKYYELTMKEVQLKLHPDYSPTTVWGFDGRVPGPLIQAKYGEPILVRFHNHLPSVRIPQAFGIAEMTTHLHNAHTPSESDGNPVNYFNSVNDPNDINPYGYKDQHYPNVLAGFTDPRFITAGRSQAQNGDPTEALSSLWYHDHHLDFTAQNVYKGMFGCYNLFDSLDSGDGNGLHLPHGDYDVPIFFNDFLFDSHCQQVFDLFNLDGILGDRFCANGVIQPHFDVEQKRYRLRLYNPGPSRWYEFALFDGKNFLPFWQIGSDGNLLPNAILVNSVRLAVAERVDIIVDFGKIAASRLFLVNRLEQVNGRGPTGKILNPGTPIIQINVLPANGNDDSIDPAVYAVPSGQIMRPLPDPDFVALQAKAAKAKTRTWRFERGGGGWQVNGKFFDEDVVDAPIPVGSEETWVIQNPGGSWRHPVHIHFEEHRTLSRNGVAVKPNTQFNGCIDYARKDVIELNTNEEVRIFMRFRDMKGRYVMHCHNVVHEDHAMMIRWDII